MSIFENDLAIIRVVLSVDLVGIAPSMVNIKELDALLANCNLLFEQSTE
jgi:hypothetical protein